MSRVIIGIDPGITGAIAVLDDEGLSVADMPAVATKAGRQQVSPHLLRELLEPLIPFNLGGGLLAVVEEVHAMPKQGVSSMFSFGQSYGTILGVLGGLYIPYKLVTPNAWMKNAGVKGKRGEGPVKKDLALTRVLEYFPDKADFFSLKKHHGRADAALIAWVEKNNPV